MQQLQRGDGPVVYVIGFVDETKGGSSTIRALQAISQNTGGTAYFPEETNSSARLSRMLSSSSTTRIGCFERLDIVLFPPPRRALPRRPQHCLI